MSFTPRFAVHIIHISILLYNKKERMPTEADTRITHGKVAVTRDCLKYSKF